MDWFSPQRWQQLKPYKGDIVAFQTTISSDTLTYPDEVQFGLISMTVLTDKGKTCLEECADEASQTVLRYQHTSQSQPLHQEISFEPEPTVEEEEKSTKGASAATRPASKRKKVKQDQEAPVILGRAIGYYLFRLCSVEAPNKLNFIILSDINLEKNHLRIRSLTRLEARFLLEQWQSRQFQLSSYQYNGPSSDDYVMRFLINKKR